MGAVITGATGFLGRHVAQQLLARGERVLAVSRNAARAASTMPDGVTVIDSTAPRAELVAACERVSAAQFFHLAASPVVHPHGDDLEASLEASVGLGVRVLDALSGTRDLAVVAALSYWCFDRRGGESPNSVYAAGKLAFASLARVMTTSAAQRFGGAVIYDVYGPADIRPKLIPQLLRAAQTGAVLPIRSRATLFAPIHVADAAASLLRAADAPAPLMAIGPSQVVSVGEVIDLVERVTGRPVQVALSEAPASTPSNVENLDMFPAVRPALTARTLRDGLQQCWDQRAELPSTSTRDV